MAETNYNICVFKYYNFYIVFICVYTKEMRGGMYTCIQYYVCIILFWTDLLIEVVGGQAIRTRLRKLYKLNLYVCKKERYRGQALCVYIYECNMEQ